MIDPQRLQKYSLFGGLLEDQIKQILPHMTEELWDAGVDIIVEGTPNDKIRFILEGQAAVVKRGITLHEFKEGDTFGEMEVLDVMPSAATIRTLVPTRTFSISNRGLREIYKTDVQSFSLLVMNLARELSRRLRLMDDKAVANAGE